MFSSIKKFFSRKTENTGNATNERQTSDFGNPKRIQIKADLPQYTDDRFSPENYHFICPLVQKLEPTYHVIKKRHDEIVQLLSNPNLKNGATAFHQIKQQLLSDIELSSLTIESFNQSFSISTESTDNHAVELSRANLTNLVNKVNSADLKILIVGQFKQGKSTLINALLGEKILPAYSTPCTAVITELKYGEQKKAILHFKSHIEQLPNDLPPKIEAHIKSHQYIDVPPLEVDVYDLESCLVISDPVKDQNQSVSESPYAKCEVFWPLPLCRDGVQIIDSPGLNEAVSREKTTMDYIDQVDMVIHVLNCLQLAGKYDQDFIDTAKCFGFENLIFACNRYDQLNNEDNKVKVREYAYRKLEPQTLLGRDGIYFIASYPALNAKVNHDPLAYANSGFEDFERGLAELIINDRAKIKIQPSLLLLSNEIEHLVEDRIVPLQRLLDKSAIEIEKRYQAQKPKLAELERQIVQLRSMLREKANAINTQASSWVAGFIDEYIGRIPTIVSDAPIEIMMDAKELQETLNQHLQSHLNKTAADWINGTLIPRLKIETEILQRDIVSHLQNITHDLSTLNSDLSVTVYKSPSDTQVANVIKPINVRTRGNTDVIAVGSVGGIASYGVAAGIAMLVGGSASLLVGILGGIALGGIYAEKKLKQVKAEFAAKMQQQLKLHRTDFINAISKNCSTSLSNKVVFLIDNAEKKLMATKTSLETALVQTQTQGQKIASKKEELEEYKKVFLGIKHSLDTTAQLMK